MHQKQSLNCEVLPLFKPLGLFFLVVVLWGYVWAFIVSPREALADFIVPALMWTVVSVPLLIVIRKIGTGASFSERHLEFVGILGKRKRYQWQDVKKIKLSTGRGKLRFVYVEFNNRNRILISNYQIGFWGAAKCVTSTSEKNQIVCDYAIGAKRKFWNCDNTEGVVQVLWS